jgi:hypothetical protein
MKITPSTILRPGIRPSPPPPNSTPVCTHTHTHTHTHTNTYIYIYVRITFFMYAMAVDIWYFWKGLRRPCDPLGGMRTGHAGAFFTIVSRAPFHWPISVARPYPCPYHTERPCHPAPLGYRSPRETAKISIDNAATTRRAHESRSSSLVYTVVLDCKSRTYSFLNVSIVDLPIGLLWAHKRFCDRRSALGINQKLYLVNLINGPNTSCLRLA